MANRSRNCLYLAFAIAALGAVSWMPGAAQQINYSYDSLGRLTEACHSVEGRKIVYQYDATGNRTTVTNGAACGPVTLSIAPAASVIEGGTLSFTVSRSGPTDTAISVSFASSDGTATAGADYTTASGVLNFAIGEATKTLTIATTDDTAFESAETLSVTLSNPTGGVTITSAQGSGTINDNDGAPSFSIAGATAQAGSTITFTVSKSGSTGLSHAVNYATSNGTAVAGTHYAAASGSLTFSALETSKTFTVNTVGGSVPTGSVGFTSTLTAPTNGATLATGQASGTINAPPLSTISIANAAAVAEGGTLSFTVTRSGTSSAQQTVNFATANGTATSGSDYTANSGTLTFAVNETTKTINVVTADDAVFEADETVLINLSNPSSGAQLGTSQASGTINNNDTAPSFAIAGSTVTAGGGLTFTVTKSGSTALQHSVNYGTSNGTATAGAHYTATSGTLTFAAAEATKSFTVATTTGSVPSGNRTMTGSLSGATSSATIATSQATGTINAPANTPPVANQDLLNGSFEIMTSAVVSVLANDSDPDGDALSITAASCVSSGCEVEIIGADLFVIGTMAGPKLINYTITDARGASASSTATIYSFYDCWPNVCE